ncbi:MAG TPA: N-acetyltransferase [Metabacillus sp.]|nr:N-acetyltransferase [Metabacillus sp.]
MLMIRNVNQEDLPALLVIEHLCFTKDEAATEEAFRERIRFIADSFFVAEEAGEVVGLVNGPVTQSAFITDDLFQTIKPNQAFGGHQTILGLAVAPTYQGRGVAKALLLHFETEARAKKRETITLTCKENLLPFYEKHGFKNDGLSSSEHGGEVWYNMSKKLL